MVDQDPGRWPRTEAEDLLTPFQALFDCTNLSLLQFTRGSKSCCRGRRTRDSSTARLFQPTSPARLLPRARTGLSQSSTARAFDWAACPTFESESLTVRPRGLNKRAARPCVRRRLPAARARPCARTGRLDFARATIAGCPSGSKDPHLAAALGEGGRTHTSSSFFSAPPAARAPARASKPGAVCKIQRKAKKVCVPGEVRVECAILRSSELCGPGRFPTMSRAACPFAAVASSLRSRQLGLWHWRAALGRARSAGAPCAAGRSGLGPHGHPRARAAPHPVLLARQHGSRSRSRLEARGSVSLEARPRGSATGLGHGARPASRRGLGLKRSSNRGGQTELRSRLHRHS
jgi:hypothetical protein